MNHKQATTTYVSTAYCILTGNLKKTLKTATLKANNKNKESVQSEKMQQGVIRCAVLPDNAARCAQVYCLT